jgi:hypothetical protein
MELSPGRQSVRRVPGVQTQRRGRQHANRMLTVLPGVFFSLLCVQVMEFSFLLSFFCLISLIREITFVNFFLSYFVCCVCR